MFRSLQSKSNSTMKSIVMPIRPRQRDKKLSVTGKEVSNLLDWDELKETTVKIETIALHMIDKMKTVLCFIRSRNTFSKPKRNPLKIRLNYWKNFLSLSREEKYFHISSICKLWNTSHPQSQEIHYINNQRQHRQLKRKNITKMILAFLILSRICENLNLRLYS